jgi:hypothetical protein
MGRRRSGERFLGPYDDRGRWRVIHVAADGTRTDRFFASEKRAREFVDPWNREVQVARDTLDNTVEIIGFAPGTKDDETALHRRFAAHRASVRLAPSEWVRRPAMSEWFVLHPDLLAWVATLGTKL